MKGNFSNSICIFVCKGEIMKKQEIAGKVIKINKR